MRRYSLILLTLWFFHVGLIAQPVDDDLPKITGCLALKNIWTVATPGQVPERQTLILRDGIIQQIGRDIPVPPDAYVIPGDSLYAYPAFIDALSYTGIKEQEQTSGRGGPPANREKPDLDKDGNASLEEAGITPFEQARNTFIPNDKTIGDWRAHGFALAHVVPRGKMIPGKGALVVLSGNKTDDMLWLEDVSMYGQWAGAGNIYPSTIIAVMAKWRELYHNAEQDAQHQKAYADVAFVSRPPYNRAHEALIPLVNKKMTLYFRASKMKDISRALDLQHDLGMRMVLCDAEEAYMLKDQLKANPIPLILSTKLPEDKGEKGKDEKPREGMRGRRGPDAPTAPQPAPETEMKKDSTVKSPEIIAFEKRRAESLEQHRKQAADLTAAGIPFSFSTMSVKASDFNGNIQLMIKNGLDTVVALRALTTEPAKLLGLEKYCGTLTAGKMANVMITTKPVFAESSSIKYMVVEGNLYTYDITEKKKPVPGQAAETGKGLEGNWSYELEMPEETILGTFEFLKHDAEWSGIISSTRITSGNQQLEHILLNNNHLSFTYDHEEGGQIMKVEFDLDLDGDQLDGKATIGEMGSFPLTAQRIKKPEHH